MTLAETLPRWPVDRMEEALDRLTDRSPHATTYTFAEIAHAIDDPRQLETWLYAAAARRGIDAEPLRVRGRELAGALRSAAPGLIVVLFGVLAVKRIAGTRATLLVPGGGEIDVPVQRVLDAMYELWERRYGLRSVDALLAAADVPTERRTRTRAALMREQLEGQSVDAGWSVRLAPSAPVSAQLGQSHQGRRVVALVGAFVVAQLSTLLAWGLLGRGVLSGAMDRGWLFAWALALATAALFQVLSSYWQGLTVIALGSLLKRRALVGALRLPPDVARTEGLGRSMGRVLEADAIEDLSLAGGLMSVLGAIELTIALAVVASASALLFALFLALTLVTVAVCARFYRDARGWTHERTRMTHDLIERLLGHRTRVVQEDARHWHDDEDRALAAYADSSRRYDTTTATAAALLPRAPLVIGLLGLAPLFIHPRPDASAWVALGGILLAQRALARLTSGLTSLAVGAIAWRGAGPLFAAAGKPEALATAVGLGASLRRVAPGEPLLTLKNVAHRYAADRPPVLRGADLAIDAGDKVLLEGASGSGKSTLASIVAGLAEPSAGLVLLGGFDRQTLGAAVWRKRVAAAPQQHENHLLQGTLAFNLLLGREWPPTDADMAEAELVCQELGLGPLLDAMPGRLMQHVGAAGWRLSHGEQSRVYIARALLQKSDLVLLDESFAALDPETVSRAMACARRRAGSLLVVAHP